MKLAPGSPRAFKQLPGETGSAITTPAMRRGQPVHPPVVTPSDPTVLYRLFDGIGQLLYVGITRRLGARLKHHRLSQPWWAEVARHELQEFSDRDEALQAETIAILTERPLHNLMPRSTRLDPWAALTLSIIHARQEFQEERDMADAGDVKWHERLRTAISALQQIEEQVLPELRKRVLAELREQRGWWTAAST